MQEGAKKRLVGATVIVALAVIFVPMLFEEDAVTNPPPEPAVIPEEPVVDDRFRSESFPTSADSALDLPEETWIDPAAAALPIDEGAEPSDGGPLDESGPTTPIGVLADSDPAPRTGAPGGVADAPPPLARDDGMPSYVTQVASLGTADGAKALADKLRGEGYSAFVEPAEVNGRRYYRVRVGPDVDRASAEKTANRLRQQYKDPFVQRYP